MTHLQTIISKYEGEMKRIWHEEYYEEMEKFFKTFAADLVREAFAETKVEKKGRVKGEGKLWSAHYLGFDEALSEVEARQQEFINEQQ